MDLEKRLQHKLNQRLEKNELRSLNLPEYTVDFSSNDYLGLGLIKAPVSVFKGLNNRMGSRLITGNSVEHMSLESWAARFWKSESALYFNSGYDANIGLFSSLLSKGDTYIYDALSHASIKDGIRLSAAKAYSFKHNNLVDLRNKIEKAEGHIVVITESVFSMDGDLAPLVKLVELADELNFNLIVDEAHATGIYGSKGEGLIEELGLRNKIFASIHTLGKAVGAHGALVVASRSTVNYMINFSRSFIYTTAHKSSFVHEVLATMEHCAKASAERKELFSLMAYFEDGVAQRELSKWFVSTLSPIKVCRVNSADKAKVLEKELLHLGLFTKAILSPTVPVNEERLRICLHSYNTKDEIDRLLNFIQSQFL